MPSRDAFGEGDYEAFRSIYAEEAGDVLVQATLENIGALLGGAAPG